MALRALHLCSGYGGFELALRPWNVRTVGHVERDAHAAATLVARMGEQALDTAPIWDDLATFDGQPWRGAVDIVTAGFPCQPFSAAGKRLGTDDDRWLWPHISRIIRDVGPRFIVLENVTELVRRGGPHVLSDLTSLGFNAEWGCLQAAAVGAPHQRNRFWLLAYRDGDRFPEARPDLAVSPNQSCPRCPSMGVTSGDGLETAGAVASRQMGEGPGGTSVRDLADTMCAGIERLPGCRCDAPVADEISCNVGHPSSNRLETPNGHPDARQTEPARAYRGPDHTFPPYQDDTAGWEQWVANGGAQPVFRRSTDGATGRLVSAVGDKDRLHLLGNGLVPQCATAAIAALAQRINDRRD